MSDTPQTPPTDPIAEGARARTQGRPKDAGPYLADSEARLAWFDGYDGAASDQAPDLPMDVG